MPEILIKSDKVLFIDGTFFNCVIGKNGITDNKTEGDLATPAGVFNIEKVFYREDRVSHFKCDFELIPIQKDMGWCDDSTSVFYNQLIRLPFEGSFENMWREDELYDIVAVISYNTNPVVSGRGSAIFLHVAKMSMEYTKGCIALAKEDLVKLLVSIRRETDIKILK